MIFPSLPSRYHIPISTCQHLNIDFLTCPVTQKPYIFEIDSVSDEAVFSVSSPLHFLEKPYKETRFGVFSFEAGDHGFIRNGQKSWAE